MQKKFKGAAWTRLKAAISTPASPSIANIAKWETCVLDPALIVVRTVILIFVQHSPTGNVAWNMLKSHFPIIATFSIHVTIIISAPGSSPNGTNPIASGGSSTSGSGGGTSTNVQGTSPDSKSSTSDVMMSTDVYRATPFISPTVSPSASHNVPDVLASTNVPLYRNMSRTLPKGTYRVLSTWYLPKKIKHSTCNSFLRHMPSWSELVILINGRCIRLRSSCSYLKSFSLLNLDGGDGCVVVTVSCWTGRVLPRLGYSELD